MAPGAIVFILVALLFVFFGLVVFIGAPYVPSHKKDIKRLFEHLAIGEADLVIDIGSGDGVVLRTASQTGARAVGYEINPFLVFIARMLSASDRKVVVLMENAWAAKFPPETTLVYAFAVQRDEKKLSRLVQREADRLEKPLTLICYGSPFRTREAVGTFEAYHIYTFQPLQSKNA